jgi:hypothetical protein
MNSFTFYRARVNSLHRMFLPGSEMEEGPHSLVSNRSLVW